MTSMRALKADWAVARALKALLFDDEEKCYPFHVVRAPLPWRDSDITECGLPTAAVNKMKDRARVLGWLESGRNPRRLDGMCGSCLASIRSIRDRNDGHESTAERMFREVIRARNGSDARFEAELEAMVEVAARHREEFTRLADAHLAALTLQRGLDQKKPLWKRMRGEVP